MDDVKIFLRYNYGFRWYNKNGVYVKGYLIFGNEVYEGKNLIELIMGINDYTELVELLKNAFGVFSMIITLEDGVLLAGDITRTFPIFYHVSDKSGIVVSDDAFYLRDILQLTPRYDSVIEFLRGLYVTGRDTLLDGLYQVQAGEIVYITLDGHVKSQFYHLYTVSSGDIFQEDYQTLKSNLRKVLNNIIDRLLLFVGDRSVVVPLSGGYDSRFIVTSLKQRGVDVICYTYGRRDSPEVSVAKEVSKKLGCEWHFVEYNNAIIDESVLRSREFEEFFKYAFNFVSTIHLQDFFAIKYLSENKAIPRDSVIVPGHSGDFLGGSHLRKLPIPKTVKDVVDIIFVKHYEHNSYLDQNDVIVKKLQKYTNMFKGKKILPYSLDDNWNMKERQSKYIVNSNRVYEFFGYKHAIPLWDRELVEFFRRVPLKYKTNKILYDDILLSDIFRPLGVDFITHGEYKPYISKIRYFAKKYLPYKIQDFIARRRWKDINNYCLIVEPLAQELGEHCNVSNALGLLARWCLYKARINERDKL
ncbi:asparagine synthase C-terminal domain-containing protein [Thermococcus gammatolerans]|uniref:Asparagine synthetase related protein n=1 Tax=Thermococcus gammatolerans (strain DSM 15229 / JCM 11827 / EJ3) TaxID=593117 RepID=C5A2Y4_THEGJ|nr:asparagine synthase C-terminal domain-containing protein [Thermococcus gammatolerans]ACS34645.1 Asparagine synthetase related protein [Thermococcus gammatolerans EJ3]